MDKTRRDFLESAALGSLGLAAMQFATAVQPALAQDSGKSVAWVYTDKLSAKPGEQVAVHLSASAPTANLRLERAGLKPETVCL